MYLESTGNWGRIMTKPVALFQPTLVMNAQATMGEIRFQLADVESRPIPGLTFEECIPFRDQEAVYWPLKWRAKSLSEITGKPVRLELMFRHARIYALRGDFHFLDAQDWHLLSNGMTIDPRWFDF